MNKMIKKEIPRIHPLTGLIGELTVVLGPPLGLPKLPGRHNYLIKMADDGITPLYGFKIKLKTNQYQQLRKQEENRGSGIKSNGYSFEKTQYDYNGKYE